ncbi:MAG: hypothetical protein QXW94_04775 [Desulfurococcaceae archaeon]
MKEESRILAYGLSDYYGAFATYRKDFLEEFNVVQVPATNLSRYLRSKLNTYSEISYVIPCTENKYNSSVQGFKVFEGWVELAQRRKYCQLINLILCILNRRGLINPLGIELLVEQSEKCFNVVM